MVAAALAAYLGWLLETALADQLDQDGRGALAATYDLIEELAGSNDTQVLTLVEDEIFENLRVGDEAWREFSHRLGPKARELLTAWSRRNSR